MTNTQIIEKFMEKHKIKSELLDYKKVKTESGEIIYDILKKEAERLMSYIQEGIDAYYASYIPLMYDRSYDLKNSLFIMEEKNSLGVSTMVIGFDKEKSWKESYVTGEEDSGYTPVLMDVGWVWKDKSKNIPRFSYFDGAHYIKSAIDKFNANNKYNIKVKIDKKSFGWEIPEYESYF